MSNPYTALIPATECIGNSLNTINTNFSNLANEATNINTNVLQLEQNINTVNNLTNTLSTIIRDLSSTPIFYDESTFAYTKPPGRIAGLANQWVGLYKNPARTPVQVTFSTTRYKFRALINATVHVSLIDMWHSMWARVANITNRNSPSSLVMASQEGHVSYSEGNTINMNKVILLAPNTRYTFQLQHYMLGYNRGSISINGWHTNTRSPQSINNTTNINAYSQIYAKSNPGPGQVGITASGDGVLSTLANNAVSNTSFLQVTLI
jgi:hypothetical protein